MRSLAIVLLVLMTQLAAADAQLTGLFEQLREAPDAAQAAQVEARIWQRWMQHENAEVNEVFAGAVQLLEVGDLPAAVRQFTVVLQMAPDFAEAWNKRATAYFLMDELPASVADIERTLVLEPRHFGALSGLGLIFLSGGDLHSALAAFEKVLAIYPHSESALIHVQNLRRAIQENSI